MLVMRHGGVCVPRQYARFAGVAYGAKCNAFFDRLVRRGFARAIDCIHNRARLYHVHSKALYHVVGDAGSRYRRLVSPRLAIERLMLLDAVLTVAGRRVDHDRSGEGRLPGQADRIGLRGDEPDVIAGGRRDARAWHCPARSRSAWSRTGARFFCTWQPSVDGRDPNVPSGACHAAPRSRRPGRYESSSPARLTASTTRIKPSSMRNSSRRCLRRRSPSSIVFRARDKATREPLHPQDQGFLE